MGESANAIRYHFADFTRSNYRSILDQAKRRFTFGPYPEGPASARGLLWRHDVDMSPHCALKLARIEADSGVMATYFFLLHSDFYNLLEREIMVCVREILSLGHEIGLHFDGGHYAITHESRLEEKLDLERRLLTDLFDCPIRVFSYHNPDQFTLSCKRWRYAEMVNTYAEFFQKEAGYCSDSNGYWRNGRLVDILGQTDKPCLQVLTHPEWWQDRPMSPRERVQRCIAGRAEKVQRTYDDALRRAGRENIDWDT